MKLNILQEERNKDFATLIREEIQSVRGELAGFTERQGKRWRALGTRLVEFVGAGKSVGFFIPTNKADNNSASMYGLIIFVLAKSMTKYKAHHCDILHAPKEGMLQKFLGFLYIDQSK